MENELYKGWSEEKKHLVSHLETLIPKGGKEAASKKMGQSPKYLAGFMNPKNEAPKKISIENLILLERHLGRPSLELVRLCIQITKSLALSDYQTLSQNLTTLCRQLGRLLGKIRRLVS